MLAYPYRSLGRVKMQKARPAMAAFENFPEERLICFPRRQLSRAVGF